MLSIEEDLTLGIFVKSLTKISIEIEEGIEVNMITLEPEWANQIVKYLKNGELANKVIRVGYYLPLM